MKKTEPKVFTPEVIRRLKVINFASRTIRSLGYSVEECDLKSSHNTKPALNVVADPNQSLMPLIRKSKTFWESKGGQLHGIMIVPDGEVIWKIAA